MKARARLAAIAVVAAGWAFDAVCVARGQAVPLSATVVRTEGSVSFRASAATNWIPAQTNQSMVPYDRLETRARSRAAVQLAPLDVSQVDEQSIFELLPPVERDGVIRLNFTQGSLYFLDHNGPKKIEVETPSVTAGIDGTEFHLRVETNGHTELTLFDGLVTLSNRLGSVDLKPGEQGIGDPGLPPTKTAILDARSIIQWCLYYPGVLAPSELSFSATEASSLAASLAAYRQGNLLRALALHPTAEPTSNTGHAYLTGLLLSVGRAAEASARLETNAVNGPLANSLRTLIAAVQLRSPPSTDVPTTASEWLAHSYEVQARFRLEEALADARRAVALAPDFGFGWARVADLEFSFGRLGPTRRALDRALELAPENAQAHALRGFVLAGERRFRQAAAAFERAIALDSALGNAWLGRGLLRLRAGEIEAGRRDLQTAAVLEPNRSLLRSYLGKAFAQEFLTNLADAEFRLALTDDPADPTPWLYSGLLRQQQYRFNEGISNLEHSATLNTNRQVYRSRFLLDQDQAVRSSRLAPLFQSAGLDEVSLREAARSVAYDYGNYSAHLFLADSFNALRDPTRFNLRYETVWFNELLLANLLAPVGAGALSPNVSQQEYSRLFERPRVGLSSTTEYRSDGQWREIASQFGTVGNTGWSLDLEYQHNDGVRPNNDLDRLEWYSTVKQQLGPRDTALLLVKYQDFESGDNFQYTDPAEARPAYRFTDAQHPLAVAGLHHEWQPGIHTLVLGGRLANEVHFTDEQANQLMLRLNTNGEVRTVFAGPLDVDYHGDFEAWTGELNQIIERGPFTLVGGVRAQSGTFTANALMDSPPPSLTNNLPVPAYQGAISEDFNRLSLYAYNTWEILPTLTAIGGVAYNRVTFPANFRAPPFAVGTETRDQVGPKGALLWTPASWVTLRSAYARSLGGVSFDESFRLEPSQLAGFSQAFRTLASESLSSTVSAPDLEVAGAALDLKLGAVTYAGLTAERLESEVDEQVGAFAGFRNMSPIRYSPTTIAREQHYLERSLRADVHRLIGAQGSVGLRGAFTRSEFVESLPTVPVLVRPPDSHQAELWQVGVYANWNHPSGWFVRTELDWYRQENFGYTPGEPEFPGDEFPQLNLFAGFRFPRERGELVLGGLNLTGEDYRLNPLNPYRELPREPVFYTRLRFSF